MTRRAQHWQMVMQEAWDAYWHGSSPVGACVVEQNGTVLARGRNRLGEERRVDGFISRHRLAQAEISALLSLPEMNSQASRRLMLISSLEPCPMCLGAMRMQRINTLAYAGHTDALSSTVSFSHEATEVHRAPLKVERFCAVLLLTFFLDGEMPREHGFFKVNQEKQSEHFERALKLHQNGMLRQLWKQQSNLATALEVLA